MNLLRDVGHQVGLYTINGIEMRETRNVAACFIFKQSQRSEQLQYVKFDPETVDVSDILNDDVYYVEFQFIPFIALFICIEGSRQQMCHTVNVLQLNHSLL